MTVKQKDILVVDDEPAIRKLLIQKLSSEGYQCQEASNAEQTIDKLGNKPVDLVILDIKLLSKSGMELLPELRTLYPDTMVIMAGVVTETNIAIQCIKQGADDYLCKPFNLDEVTLSVERTLQKRSLQLKIKEYQQHLEQKVKKQTKEIRKLFLSAIEALVFALEAKDRYTAGHSLKVTEIAMAIGSELALSINDMEDLRWASLLHDVGKIAVDQLIQNKPGKLTQEEYGHIMIHAHVGASIVKPVVNEKVVEMIEHHHDRYDGSGLHQVVAGQDIPLGARILAVADAFSAMTSERPYRSAMSVEEALHEIRRCTEIQFDPVVTNALFRTVTAKITA